jgi:hypothetical protein
MPLQASGGFKSVWLKASVVGWGNMGHAASLMYTVAFTKSWKMSFTVAEKC